VLARRWHQRAQALHQDRVRHHDRRRAVGEAPLQRIPDPAVRQFGQPRLAHRRARGVTAQRLKALAVARCHQVVIVTHLAPVAALGQHHFLVNKTVGGGGGGRAGDKRTRSSVRLLKGADVEKELAAMAMGDGADAAALQSARRLVAKAKESAAAS